MLLLHSLEVEPVGVEEIARRKAGQVAIEQLGGEGPLPLPGSAGYAYCYPVFPRCRETRCRNLQPECLIAVFYLKFAFTQWLDHFVYPEGRPPDDIGVDLVDELLRAAVQPGILLYRDIPQYGPGVRRQFFPIHPGGKGNGCSKRHFHHEMYFCRCTEGESSSVFVAVFLKGIGIGVNGLQGVHQPNVRLGVSCLHEE